MKMHDLHTGGAHPMVCFAALGPLLNEKVGARCMGMCIFYIYIFSLLGAEYPSKDAWVLPGCLLDACQVFKMTPVLPDASRWHYMPPRQHVSHMPP